MSKKDEEPDSWVSRARLMMEKRGLTYDDVAPSLEVTSRSAVGHYLAGRRELSAFQAVRLAGRLGCRVGWLLEGELPIEKEAVQDRYAASIAPQKLLDQILSLSPGAYSAVTSVVTAMVVEQEKDEARKSKRSK